jgi:hypothetical protein
MTTLDIAPVRCNSQFCGAHECAWTGDTSRDPFRPRRARHVWMPVLFLDHDRVVTTA